MAFGNNKEKEGATTKAPKQHKSHRPRKTVTTELGMQQRNKSKNLKIILASALLAIIVFIALQVIQSNILNREEKIKVYVVSTAMTEGTKITEENFKTYLVAQERVTKTLPENYITEDKRDILVDTFVSRDFIKNDVITSDMISDRQSYIADINNPIETTLSVSSISDAVGGIIREGDLINIHSIVTDRKEGTTSTPIMIRAYVTKAFDSSGGIISTEDNTTPTAMFSLVISEDMEKAFNESIFSGTLKVSKILDLEENK